MSTPAIVINETVVMKGKVPSEAELEICWVYDLGIQKGKRYDSKFCRLACFSIIGLDNETAFGSAVNFFVYDSIKILLLLFLISALMGIVNVFSVERSRNYLSPLIELGIAVSVGFSLWSDNAILLLFVHSAVYRIRKGRNTAWGNSLVSYYITACQ